MKTILLIEDEEALRSALEAFLTQRGYAVDLAEDGEAGLELAFDRIPDLVICDASLPKLDGYEVLSRLRGQPSGTDIPFVFLSGDSRQEQIRRAMQLGADDYLTKPIRLEVLLEAVQHRLRRADSQRRRLDELRASLAGMVSHEFLTPLNGIIGYTRHLAELLEDAAAAPSREDLLGPVRGIEGSSRRLHHLVRRFMLYTDLLAEAGDSVRAGQTAAAHCQIDGESLASLVPPEALAYTHLECESLGLAVRRSQLEVVVVELVGNALKFAGPAPIRLTVGRVGEGWAEVAVHDTGPGMAPAEIARVGGFTQFNRRRLEQQGAGLGLALCQVIAQIHGGRLELGPSPEGGLRAALRLPAVSSPGSEPAAT